MSRQTMPYRPRPKADVVQFTGRIDKSCYNALLKMARKENKSLNAVLNRVLKQSIA